MYLKDPKKVPNVLTQTNLIPLQTKASISHNISRKKKKMVKFEQTFELS
jgi:hypothetical protein